jgi:ankyrin repeat protein
MTHARIENVASQVRDGIDVLFDLDKPYFEAWVQLHDIDADDDGYFPNMPDPERGARPLYYAALCGFPEIVEHLTLKYPQYASARGGVCGTALHAASFKGHLQVVRYLLQHGVDVNARDSGQETPLLLASFQGRGDVVQCLLDYGANVDLRDQFLNTPLNLAADWRHFDVVRLLLEHNADVNSQENRGLTPLHQVVMGTSFEAVRLHIARLLLKHGANPNARNHELRTPLHVLSQRPDLLDVLRVLLEHGADLDAEDKDGKTPLQLSLEGEYGDVTRFLSGYSSKPTSQ